MKAAMYTCPGMIKDGLRRRPRGGLERYESDKPLYLWPLHACFRGRPHPCIVSCCWPYRTPSSLILGCSPAHGGLRPLQGAAQASTACRALLRHHKQTMRPACVPFSEAMCTLQLSFSARHWDGLLAILACSDGALRQVVQRWPGIAELTVADVMQRLLCLKVRLMPMRQSL